MITPHSSRLLHAMAMRQISLGLRSISIRHFISPAPSIIQQRPQPHPAKRALTTPKPYQTTHIRWYSTPEAKPKLYNFEDVKSLCEQQQPNRILIDVREPSEYQEGYIPTAINLPIKSAPEALLLPAEDFEDRFGMPKPAVDQEVIFYCRSGVRSGAAAQLAEQAGYQKIGEYKGSYLDWSEKGGPVGR